MDMDMDMEAIKMLSPNRTEADQANQSQFNCISKCSCKIKQKRSTSNSSFERKKKVIGAGCCRSSGNLAQLPFFVTALCMLIFELSLVPPIRSMSSPNETAWPPMRHYDIWGDDTAQPDNRQEDMLAEEVDLQRQLELNMDENMEMDEGSFPKETISQNETNSRQGKVIHLFPVPVDGDCLSNDGRRMGNCLNAYECRQKDGQARGECAMGFGVCCVFVANCNTTISNNITYIVSPGFPSFMPSNFSGCNLRVKMMTDDISQVRIDFHHFTLGQPNRRTGVCDGDAFQIGGGPGGNISLCGQNSGQHLYYDVGARATPRQSTLYGSLRPLNGSSNSSNSNSTGDRFINIDLNLANRFLPLRIWEISVVQIPFSQRAPAGCLQYHTGTEGLLQTFNFAENGRHLANQNYRICMRQELDMCSIVYQPCDQQSFRIGGGGRMATRGGDSDQGAGSPPAQSDMAGVAATAGNVATTTPVPTSSTLMQMLANMANSTTTTLMSMMSGNSTTASNSNSSAATSSTAAMSAATATATTTTTTTPTPLRSSTVASTSTSSEAPASSPASDDVEGSGGEVGEGSDDDDDGGFLFFRSPPTTEEPGFSRRPRPVGGGSSGGFDILGFLRNAFDLQLRRRRQARQFFSTCTDRITMPCIIEDFIGTGLGPLPGCEPIHCGSQFCSSGTWPCRIESTVTPFYIGVHFGNGMGAGKANAEDNVGACLRYSQVQCM